MNITPLPPKVVLAILLLLPAFAPDLRASTPLSATARAFNIPCYNGYDGGFIITATGGTAPYQYSLDNIGNYNTGFQLNDTFRSLSAGTYVIRVADAAGSSVVINAVIAQPPALSISDSVINATNGTSNGAIFTFVTGGTQPYAFSWDGLADTSYFVSGLSSGYQTVTVTDSEGCSTSLQVYVDTGSSAFSATAAIDGWPSGCYPNQTFGINVSVNGGSAPYLFSLDGGPYLASNAGMNFNFYNNLAGPVHSIRVMDANHVLLEIVDTFPGIAAAPLSAYASVTNATGGNDNGSAVIIAAGGSPGYTFDLEISPLMSNLGPGTYGMFVMDTLGCSFSFAFSVNDTSLYSNLSATGTIIVPVCTNRVNFNDGQILVNVSGGRFPYQMELDSGGFAPANYSESQSLFWVTDTGMHTIYVHDGLDSLFVLHISVPGDSFGLRGRITNASANLNNGEVSLITNSGSAPYSYFWSDGTSAASDSGLAVGTNVLVTVTDALGCQAYGDFNIDSGTFAAAITSVIGPTACNGGGQFTVTATGGTQPYLDQYGNQLTPSITYNGLPSGNYTYLVIDALMDTITLIGTIAPAPSPLNAEYTSSASSSAGNDGSITALVTGGTPPYTYLWSISSLDTSYVNGISPGNYSLSVTDSAGCNLQLYNIMVYDSSGQGLSASVYAFPGSPCFNASGSIAISVSGGTTPYIFIVGNITDTSYFPNYEFGSLMPGIYPVMVIDAAADTFITSVTLSPAMRDPAITIAGTVANANGGLANGAILATVSGGTAPYIYNWQDNSTYTSIGTTSQELSNEPAGNYQLIVTDALGCSQLEYFTIDSGSFAFAASTQVNNNLCHGQASVLANATGGTQPYLFQINAGGYQPSNQYFTNTNEFENLVAGIYIINVKDATGAILSIVDTIAPQADEIIATGTVTNTTTPGDANGSISIHVRGGLGHYGYYWTNDNSDASVDSNLSTGTYTPFVYDSIGCEVNPVFVVGSGSTALSATFDVKNISCFGDSTGTITVSGNGANQPLLYSLGSGDFSTVNVFSNLPAGTYAVTIRDATGATTVVSPVISQPTAPVAVSGTISNASIGHSNGSITLNISGGTVPYTAWWTDIPTPAIFRTSLYGGTYDADIIDAAGCNLFAVFNVDTGVAALVTSVSNVACYGDSTGSIHIRAFGGTPAYSYRLGNGSYQPDSVFSGLQAGTYTITVRAGANDSAIIQQTITQAAPIIIQGSVNNALDSQENGEITLAVSGGTQPYTFNWGGGISTENRTGIGQGAYTVVLTDSNGCQASASFLVPATGMINLTIMENTMTLYPNPASSSVEVDFSLAADQIVPFHIMDAQGQMVFSNMADLKAGENKLVVNTAAWQPGSYFIRIGDEFFMSSKLVVLH